MHYLLALSLLLFTTLTAANDAQVVTLLVKSRPAAAMIDVVRPLLGDSGGVSAFHDKLIVRGNSQQIAAVRALLDDIDRPPRRLIIEVRTSGSLDALDRDLSYGASTGDVRLGRAPRREGVFLGYRDLRTRAQHDGTQRVQALDGRPALIRTGQSVPVYSGYQYAYGPHVAQGFDVHYRDTMSGFYALPRVHGQQVTVEIYQQQEHAAAGGRFNTQQASTVLSGALGQWLSLGVIGGAHTDQQNALGRHTQTRRTDDRHIELRVIALD